MSRLLKYVCCRLLLLVAVFLPLLSQAAQEDTSAKTQVSSLWKAKDYAALEKLAEEFRSTKARTVDGRWKLDQFYQALSFREDEPSPKVRQAILADLKAWVTAIPASITAPVALAQGLADEAWKIRGSGYADTVSEQQWKGFGQKLTEARKVLEKAASRTARCPHWYVIMQRIALGQSWEDKEYNALFDAAIKAEPEYVGFYISKAYRLLPRWSGQPGDVAAFADSISTVPGVKSGAMIYALIAWSQRNYYSASGFLEESDFEWQKIREGFEALLEAYPESAWNMESFLELAQLAEDRRTVAELLPRIEERFGASFWKSVGVLPKLREWSGMNGHAPPQPVATLSFPRAGRQNGIALSADGKRLAVAYDFSVVILWDLETRKPVQATKINGYGRSLAFSPDGKLLVACTGSADSGTGELKVWQTEGLKEIASSKESGLYQVVFAADGQKIFAVSGTFAKPSGFLVEWDLKSPKSKQLGIALKRYPNAVAASPKADLLVVEEDHCLRLWDPVKEAFAVPDKVAQLGYDFFKQAFFSPDGSKLFACSSPSLEELKTGSGFMVIVDCATWEDRKFLQEKKLGGIESAALSPSGEQLATGHTEGSVFLWDLKTGKELAHFTSPSAKVHQLLFTPDGKTLIGNSSDNNIYLWNTEPAE